MLIPFFSCSISVNCHLTADQAWMSFCACVVVYLKLWSGTILAVAISFQGNKLILLLSIERDTHTLLTWWFSSCFHANIIVPLVSPIWQTNSASVVTYVIGEKLDLLRLHCHTCATLLKLLVPVVFSFSLQMRSKVPVFVHLVLYMDF